MKIKLITHAALPVHSLHDLIHKHVPHPRTAGKVLLCSTIILTGSSIALIPTPEIHPENLHFIAHTFKDGVAYTIHGIGSAPLIEAILAFVGKVIAKL